jgi:predicted aspartyl protease
MGKVIVKIKLTNLKDTFLKEAGARKLQPREVEVEALVDTGATRLYLKPSVIKKLGLARTTRSVLNHQRRGHPLQIRTRGTELIRHETDVIEVPENVPNLLGQQPRGVDFVVDSKTAAS